MILLQHSLSSHSSPHKYQELSSVLVSGVVSNANNARGAVVYFTIMNSTNCCASVSGVVSNANNARDAVVYFTIMNSANCC